MFEFWREATAAVVPGLLCQCGRRRPETAPYSLKLQLRQTFFLILQKVILSCPLQEIILNQVTAVNAQKKKTHRLSWFKL